MAVLTISGVLIGVIVFFIALAGLVSWIKTRNNAARYGPRPAMPGRPGQTRTKGLALAVLDSIPIVKFGSKSESPDAIQKDIEPGERDSTLNGDSTIVPNATLNKTNAGEGVEASTEINKTIVQTTFDENQCAICISDFVADEEVRVLPCNHRFHPECIDPWLLNISGTCPICRYDLRPNDPNNPEVIMPPEEDYLPVSSPISYIRAEALRQEAARFEAFHSLNSSPAVIAIPPPTLASPRERMFIRSRLREIRNTSRTGSEYAAELGRFYRDRENRRPSMETERVRS